MRLEGPSPFSERPAGLELERERERTLLRKFTGGPTRWLAAAMLLLTAEGCAASKAVTHEPETAPVPRVLPKPEEELPILSDDTRTIPEDQLDAYRRANRLPVEEPGKQPTMDDYLTSPNKEAPRRLLLGVNPEDINKLTRKQRRKEATEKTDERQNAIRKQRRF